MSVVALMGAGGKMGLRISRNLKDCPDYKTLYVEVSGQGKARLKSLGLTVVPEGEALKQADVVVLAVPDAVIGQICSKIVPALRSGAMVIGLDPAAAYAGVLPERDDITYFVAHPCHPPLFSDETDPEAQQDFFGGAKAKQSVVCTLFQGPEQDYAKGEAVARVIFAPVLRTHRVTIEQMAVLEPALVETLLATFLTVLHEAAGKAVAMGIPEQAVQDFLFGHVRAEIAGIFGVVDQPLSDGARLAVEKAKSQILQPDWHKVMEINNIRQSVKDITHSA
jgi:hypothetical protein